MILDEVLLDGALGQRRVADALKALSVLWVGVRCDWSSPLHRTWDWRV